MRRIYSGSRLCVTHFALIRIPTASGREVSHGAVYKQARPVVRAQVRLLHDFLLVFGYVNHECIHLISEKQGRLSLHSSTRYPRPHGVAT